MPVLLRTPSTSAVNVFTHGNGRFVPRLIRESGHHPEIADLLQAAVRAGRPLPHADSIRHRLRGDGPLGEAPTVADYLTGWLCST